MDNKGELGRGEVREDSITAAGIGQLVGFVFSPARVPTGQELYHT